MLHLEFGGEKYIYSYRVCLSKAFLDMRGGWDGWRLKLRARIGEERGEK